MPDDEAREATDEAIDLAPMTVGFLLQASAAVLQLTPEPIAAAAVGFTGMAANLFDRLQQHRRQRGEERRRVLAKLLQERLRDFEEQQVEIEQIDLFGELVTNALRDDEDDKAPIYVAVVDWMLREKPDATRVRILSSAVQDLSYLELYCFILEGAGQSTRHIHESIISPNLLWNRLTGHGLSTGASARIKGEPH